MSTLKCTYIQQASSASPNITLDSSTNATVAGTLAMGYSFKRNRIINGNMVIDQRNAGASVTPTNGQYGLDRWGFNATAASKYTAQQNAGSVTPPTGFSNYLGITSSSAYSVTSGDIFAIYQPIEGFNTADFAWGTANAKTVTLSFWVYSSLTGTFGGALRNSAANRAYPFTYVINSANTWEQKTIPIAGDTTGTWVGATNGLGVNLSFGLGGGSTYSGTAGAWTGAGNFITATGAVSVVGTNGATFYITGVQLETGSIATPYERQIYSDQLAQCQRYYYLLRSSGSQGDPFGVGRATSTTVASGLTFFPSIMRTAPTSVSQSGTATDYRVLSATGATCSAVPVFSAATVAIGRTDFTVASGLTAGYSTIICSESTTNAYLAWSAEL